MRRSCDGKQTHGRAAPLARDHDEWSEESGLMEGDDDEQDDDLHSNKVSIIKMRHTNKQTN